MKNLLLLLIATMFVGCANKQTEPDPEPAEPVMKPKETSEPVSEEVQFEAAGMTLYGTITRPGGPGPFPAVAIAAGSGPTDRNWLNQLIPGPNGSAELLAGALAEQGVVLIRYDKRGTGKTGMPPTPIAWGDYVAELNAATALLANQDYVDADRIFVAGHSEGGAHALRAAAQPATPLAGVILLSTAGRSLRDIVIWQISNQINASGLNPAAARSEIDALTKAIDAIAAGTVIDPQSVGQLQGVQQFLMALQNPQSVAFARGLLTFDPLSAFSQFELPVLVLSGARDIQVDPQLDAAPLASAAQQAGRPTTLKIVEKADHVLKLEETPREKLTPAVALRYNAADRILDPAVVTAILDFVAPKD